MAFCTKCGNQLTDDANFCSKCGTSVQAASQGLSVSFSNETTKKSKKLIDDGGDTFTDPRDGRVYKTVKIGSQVWMAENLNYDAPGSKFYDNDPKNGEKYGRLYDWETAMKASPAGWHLPSDEEWGVLIKSVGGEEMGGKYLKAKSGWNDYKGKSCNGQDTYGFAALPGGYGDSGGSFYYVGRYGTWWSSTECDSNYAYYRDMLYDHEYVNRNDYGKYGLFSVRCVQD
jgi:uncharacterized protein (TIGR02145 family)